MRSNAARNALSGCLGFALVVLAGFMKLLGADAVARFAPNIVNLHPSLLPLFPGVDGPAQAVASYLLGNKDMNLVRE